MYKQYNGMFKTLNPCCLSDSSILISGNIRDYYDLKLPGHTNNCLHLLISLAYKTRILVVQSCYKIWKCFFIRNVWIKNSKLKNTQNNYKQKKRQKDKQWSTNLYTENDRSSNTNLIKNWEWTLMLRKVKQVLPH